MKIAIVGAGVAGLSCAARLQSNGHDVVVFDKGRGPGGRLATRHVPHPAGNLSFDHGAQYFTARDPRFAAMVSDWETTGIVARWTAAGEDAWVGVLAMNAVAKALARSLTIRQNHRVGAVRRVERSWFLDDPDAGPFDAVIVATPAEQAAPLLAPLDSPAAALARSCPSEPCWTAMLGFGARLAIADDIVRDQGAIGWAARNSAKPGRDGPEAWVVQASPEWSRAHLEDDADTVVDALLSALAAQAGGASPNPIVRIGHRWRYARARSIDRGALWNDTTRIGAVGDWLTSPRIEGAWLSGRILADRIGRAGR